MWHTTVASLHVGNILILDPEALLTLLYYTCYVTLTIVLARLSTTTTCMFANNDAAIHRPLSERCDWGAWKRIWYRPRIQSVNVPRPRLREFRNSGTKTLNRVSEIQLAAGLHNEAIEVLTDIMRGVQDSCKTLKYTMAQITKQFGTFMIECNVLWCIRFVISNAVTKW